MTAVTGWRLKKQLYNRKRASGGQRIYGIAENGMTYSYDKVTADMFAKWCREKRALGEPMLFTEFYDELPLAEMDEIVVKRFVK